MVSEISQSHKIKYKIPKVVRLRDRRQNGGCQGLREEENVCSEHQLLGSGDEKVLEICYTMMGT